MKLNSLYIEKYKLLSDFTINFSKDISILIGINGSGKSTILEVIAQIFSNAALGKKSDFKFELNYTLQHNENSKTEVRLYSNKNKHILLDVHYQEYGGVRGEKMSNIFLNTKLKNLLKYFPSDIVIYYSGLSDTMKTICVPHNKELSKQSREGNVNFKRLFFYFEPALFDIILISLLSYEYGEIPEFLLEKAKIKSLQSIQIKLKKPSWAKQKIDKWWGAIGEVKTFLDFLNSKTNNIILIDSLIDKKHERKGNIVIEAINDEYLIITIIGQEKLFEIREHYADEKSLFKILNTLYIDELWDNCSFSFIKEEDGKPISFSVLSEGEQQAITIKGLTELVASDNTLFLFDEPDTYLHPSWQKEFISNISQNIENSTFIIATHSPNLVSDIHKENLFIMQEGKLKTIPFESYGKPVDDVLIDFFGLDGVRNLKVEGLINKIRNMIVSNQFETDDFKNEFENLKKELGTNDKEIMAMTFEIAKRKKSNEKNK